MIVDFLKHINFGRFTNQFKYQVCSDLKWMKTTDTSKNLLYRQKHTYIRYILIFNSICIWGRRTRNLRLCGRYLEHCLLLQLTSLMADQNSKYIGRNIL